MDQSDTIVMNKTQLLSFFAAINMIFGLFCARTLATASDLEVVEVKRNIQLSDTDPIYRDFYINAANSELKKNLVVKATRKITVKNQGQKVIGTFKTIVGLLKIIQVDGGVAVARLVELTPREDHPMLEQVGIMIGDEIDMDGSFIDNKKK